MTKMKTVLLKQEIPPIGAPERTAADAGQT